MQDDAPRLTKERMAAIAGRLDENEYMDGLAHEDIDLLLGEVERLRGRAIEASRLERLYLDLALHYGEDWSMFARRIEDVVNEIMDGCAHEFEPARDLEGLDPIVEQCAHCRQTRWRLAK